MPNYITLSILYVILLRAKYSILMVRNEAMNDWEQLITEAHSLDERDSKIQNGENVGLSKAEIEKLIRDYHSWFAKCLRALPEDLRGKFRAEFDGTWISYKIKKFFEAPTQPNVIYQAGDEKTKAVFPPWTNPYKQNFHPC